MSSDRAQVPESAASALQLQQIDKAFDAHQVLKGAHIDVCWGELHALLGENGAGKSTLMNVACGLYSADSGTTLINSHAVVITQPSDAIKYRIGMVHQHYKLVDRFSIAENVLLSCASQLRVRSVRDVIPLIDKTASELGFSVDPAAVVSDLSIAERQRIEIIKLIMLGTDILILDEPTAVLTDSEAQGVLTLLRSMANQGKAVVLITHRLQEVTEFADKVTIMRAGETVIAGVGVQTLSESQMAESMVGQALPTTIARDFTYVGEDVKPVLCIQDISVQRHDGSLAIHPLSVDVGAGEILGIAGVGGNGQPELAESLFGLRAISDGCVLLHGVDLASLSISERRQRGLRLVPADRFAYALLADLRAYENLAITDVPAGRFGRDLWLSRRLMKQHAATQFSERDITGGTPNTLSRLFSGGNAQKLLLARELSDGASMLIAHSPTRGLDVRARQVVHETIIDSVREGASCLLISEDLDEVLALSDRVAVLSRGRLQGPFASAMIDRTRIGELMAGHA